MTTGSGVGYADRVLGDAEVADVVRKHLAEWGLAGQRVVVLVPDGTRTAPVARLLGLVHDAVGGAVARLDVVVALGTHAPMDDDALARLTGDTRAGWAARGVTLHNHAWWDPDTFVSLGAIGADELAEVSEGRLRRPVEVRINRLVAGADTVIVCGPVFPHEIVGFSGGNKYFFPGVSSGEMIDVSHWLGALITCPGIIGRPGITPVRRLVDLAAARIPARRRCLAMVVAPGGHGGGEPPLHGLYAGTPEAAWAAAAGLSAQVHVRYVDRPYRTVVAVMPPMYRDLWVAGKGMYKLEPIVADGGELVIHAPHVTQVSATHGGVLAETGYHVRDFFLAHWDRYAHQPWGVLAHASHVKGLGTYDPERGERPRITVTLATGIPREVVEAHNLAWRDPAAVDPAALAAAGDPDVLVVPRAGEVLHRLAADRP